MKHTLKTMDGIAYVVLTLGIAGALTVVYGTRGGAIDNCGIPSAGRPFMKVTDVSKEKDCICREVAEVVMEQAEAGIITKEQAERLVQMCWQTEF